MNENNTIFDKSFKRMIRTCPKLLIRFVNKLFGKKYPLNAKIIFNDKEGIPKNGSVLDMDLYFTICGEKYHIEAQAYDDDMMIRLIEYAFSNVHDKYIKIDKDHARYKMAKQAVVFLKDTDRSRDKLYITLVLPDDREVEYSVPAVRALGYLPKELVKNDMEILLPFQIIRLYGRAKDYNKRKDSTKKKFLRDFSEMCSDIVSTMDKLHEEKKITTEEYKTMLDITTTLEEYVYKHIDDIPESGADSMLQEKVVFYFDKAKEMGKEEGKAEGKACALSILQTIISLKDESESDIINALIEQYDLSEDEAKTFVDEFNMISTCRNK